MVVEQGRKIATCKHLWSTMVSMASCPSLSGRPVIRSIAIWENGLALTVDGILILWV
jgi:hypothetical protein